MSESGWNLKLATERLILRPQQPKDYEAWLAGFAGRLPPQHIHDAGQVNLDWCDRTWVSLRGLICSLQSSNCGVGKGETAGRSSFPEILATLQACYAK